MRANTGVEAAEEPQFRSNGAVQFHSGAVLFGTTVLIPQFLQLMMGYSAEKAGEVLSPAGCMLMVLFPIAGLLSTKVDPRWMVAAGFGMTAVALLSHHRPEPRYGLSHHGAVAQVPDVGACVHLHTHQHAELCGSAARQKQPGFWYQQFHPEPRRQRRNLNADDVFGAPEPGASDQPGCPRDRSQSAVQHYSERISH